MARGSRTALTVLCALIAGGVCAAETRVAQPSPLPRPKASTKPSALPTAKPRVQQTTAQTLTKPKARSRAQSSPFYTSFSMGYTSHTYTETGIQPFSQHALTLKLAFQEPVTWPFPQYQNRITWGISGYLTGAVLSSNRTGVSVRFLGLNARLGYVVPDMPKDWDLSLWTGAYYTTMFVTAEDPSQTFGIQDLMGPQFYSILRRKLSWGGTASGYFKIAPVGQGFFQFPGREIAGGISYGHPLGSQLLSIGIDYSRLTTKVETTDMTSNIDSRSVTLNVGLTW